MRGVVVEAARVRGRVPDARRDARAHLVRVVSLL